MAWGNIDTMRFIPEVREYSLAVHMLNTIKPIRGNGCNRGHVPLGAREDAGKYHIRAGKVDATDVEFVLYNTPMVTFKADGRILVLMAGYSTTTTREFISAVLGVSCYNKSRKPVIELVGKNTNNTNLKSIIPDGGIALRLDTSNGPPSLVFADETKPVITGYAMNRAKTNNVRKRYSEFRKYLKAVISLRKEEIEVSSVWGSYSRHVDTTTYEAVCFTVGEIADVFGVIQPSPSNFLLRPVVDHAKWNLMHHKPVGQIRPHGLTSYADWIKSYTDTCEEFFGLIKNDQPEETKHANFYKAFLVLLTMNTPNARAAHSAEDPDKVLNIAATTIEVNFEGAFKMYHAQELLDAVVLKAGVPPNKDYTNWMWMHSPEGVAAAEKRETEFQSAFKSSEHST
jgi:hypothetical protein